MCIIGARKAALACRRGGGALRCRNQMPTYGIMCCMKKSFICALSLAAASMLWGDAKVVGDGLYDATLNPIRNLDAWRRAVDAEKGPVICATPVPRGLKRDSEAWRASRAVAD